MVHHLLPIKHFHIIFTIPEELRDWFYYNQRLCYNLLFRVAYQTIECMAGKGKTGMVATLHTWGSNLSYHPHVHCIVPAGSWLDGKWQFSKGQSTGRFFCDAVALREQYKALFIREFVKLVETNDFYWKSEKVESCPDLFELLQKDLRQAVRKKWTVRIENPVLGTEQIIEYLARYVRRVAITNSRIESITDTHVVINYKQYALQQPGKAPPVGKMEFDGAAFIHQFAQHIPPRGFHKVRYYGIYTFGNKKLKNEIYEQVTQSCLLPYQVPSRKTLIRRQLGHDPDVCTACGAINQFVTTPLVEQPNQGYHLTKNYKTPRIRAGPNGFSHTDL